MYKCIHIYMYTYNYMNIHIQNIKTKTVNIVYLFILDICTDLNFKYHTTNNSDFIQNLSILYILFLNSKSPELILPSCFMIFSYSLFISIINVYILGRSINYCNIPISDFFQITYILKQNEIRLL